MLWIESVRSLAYQPAKVSASATAKIVVVVVNGTPKLSTRLSVTSVPKMLRKTTTSQYRHGT